MDERIITFITKQINKGVSLKKIRMYLLSKGLDSRLVEQHMNNANQRSSGRKLNLFSFGSIAIIILILTAAALIIVSRTAEKTSFLDNSLSKSIEKKADMESFNKALINKQTTICDTISDSNLLDECKRITSPNSSSAENYPDGAMASDQKLLNRAIIEHDSSICLRISSKSMNEQCLGILETK